MNPGCDTMRADKVGGRVDGCEGPEPVNALEKPSPGVDRVQVITTHETLPRTEMFSLCKVVSTPLSSSL